MIKMAILDSKGVRSNNLKKFLRAYSENKGDLFIIDTYEQYDTFEKFYYKGAYDILFIDISSNINELKGFRIGESIRGGMDEVDIILTTEKCDRTLAIRGYSIGAMSFVKLPISYKILGSIMNTVSNKKLSKFSKSILVKSGNDILRICESEIQFIETAGKKILIHTIDENIECYQRMRNVCINLSDDQFIRCHNSYIINRRFIREIKEDMIYLITGSIIPISKNRKKNLLNTMSLYYGEKY